MKIKQHQSDHAKLIIGRHRQWSIEAKIESMVIKVEVELQINNVKVEANT